uniref:EGF-like domain-containing protein n=1 Tax=Caenorhabditis japonica TaxID=281687 RepID=A0A8R1EL45_CAEJA
MSTITFWNLFGIVTFLITDVFSRCTGANCDKFSCVSDFYVHRPLDAYLRPGATFHSPCSCDPDWNTMFCNQTLTALHENILPLPTVCVCRKFSDNGAKCQQFMTRCFQRDNNECSCCFNQPSEWCNQLKCKNREPDFSNANTTCVCHHNSADYPYEICKNLYPRDSNFASRPPVLEQSLERGQPRVEYVELLGNKVSTSMVSYIIVGLLLSVSLLTLVMLLVGGRRLRQHRAERQRQIRIARETLILQRADDDRYLPSA